MFTLIRIVLIFLIVHLPLPLMACGPETQIVKKPEGLRKENPDPSHTDLTTKDRQKWKSVLNWCDECDERARYTESYEGQFGGIFIHPIGGNQYIVDIYCQMAAYNGEHIYYKVTEHADTIESQLLILEQFNHVEYGDGSLVQGIKDPKGKFVRFTDSLSWGVTIIPENNKKQLIIERRFRGMGGDCPKVVEFRAKVECTADSPPPEKWKLYPAEQRAKWRIAPNPLREDWKPSSTSPVRSK